MNDWILLRLNYLLEGSNQSDNTGQIPKCAKYKKTFLNLQTGQVCEITDLQSKKCKRNYFLNLFLNVYQKCFKSKTVSILGFIVYQEYYGSVTKFINTISRKLKRKGVERLGYVWVRDIGENRFEKHFHLLIATSKMDSPIFHAIFHNKRHNKYKLEFMDSMKGIKNYLKEKELYGIGKQRSFSKSRKFQMISNKSSKIKQVNAELTHIKGSKIHIDKPHYTTITDGYELKQF